MLMLRLKTSFVNNDNSGKTKCDHTLIFNFTVIVILFFFPVLVSHNNLIKIVI